ncbi:MAG: multiubiquitin domain-containing protein [Candidatus Xenobia bacterium]
MSAEDEELELLDVEEYARAGKDKPKARRYRIRIDRTHYETPNPTPTGREILSLAGKTPEMYLLSQKVTGGPPVPVGADQEVDLREKGVERFMTVPREATEGLGLRRQFSLPPEDLEFLEGRGESWEAIVDGGTQWVLLHRFELPVGLNASRAIAAIRIVGGYPDAALDMVYFEPHLSRTDGKPINALSLQAIDGRTFQQWSRHRTPADPWRAGEDGLATHCAYAQGWLADELKKR